MSAKEVRIALVDDHTLFRKGLAELIHGLGGYQVVLQAANGRECVTAMTGGTEVDIAIVDLNMPVMDGFELIAWIEAHMPQVRSLALTFDGAEGTVARAIRAGARGFLRKDVEPEELRAALEHIHASGFYHTELVHQSMLHGAGRGTSQERERDAVLAQITPREREFLLEVCAPDERTYEQIADRMGVHRRTVDGFRDALFNKFGIKSKTGLVLFAMKWHIVDP